MSATAEPPPLLTIWRGLQFEEEVTLDGQRFRLSENLARDLTLLPPSGELEDPHALNLQLDELASRFAFWSKIANEAAFLFREYSRGYKAWKAEKKAIARQELNPGQKPSNKPTKEEIEDWIINAEYEAWEQWERCLSELERRADNYRDTATAWKIRSDSMRSLGANLREQQQSTGWGTVPLEPKVWQKKLPPLGEPARE
jgi:hypothetical protein